ncbi:MAG: hypothetical protein ABEJ94_09695 [Halorientalis sp.]
MAHPAESAFVGAIIGLVAALVAFPTRVGRLLAPAGVAVVDGIRWVGEAFPYWAFILTVFLGTMVVAVVVAYEFARVGYAAVRRAGPRTKRVVRFVTPNTPIGKTAFAFCLTILFLIGSVWALPYVIGDLGAVSDAGNFTDGDDPKEVLEEANDRINALLSGDAATHGSGVDTALENERAYDRPRPDSDGDRLKDSWERAGETPAGVALPNADPDHKDIYLQINYATYTRPLSKTEKRQLRRVWAEMPVENPDGSTGITLHIDETRPYGGPLGTTAVYGGAGNTTRFYTREYLGDRRCRYHQIVVGKVEHPTTAGRASVPGFAGYVQSDRIAAYRQARSDDDPRQVSSRVHVITHELLHNVVGPVDGGSHTSDGWLAPTASPDETFLSDAATRELNDGLAGSAYYQETLC